MTEKVNPNPPQRPRPTPTLAQLVAQDLGGKLAAEIANHAITRAQAQLDRAEIAAIKQQLEQLQKPAAKPRKKK